MVYIYFYYSKMLLLVYFIYLAYNILQLKNSLLL